MRILVLGAGLQGRAVAHDLLRSEGVATVILADRDPAVLAAAEASLAAAQPAPPGRVALECRLWELEREAALPLAADQLDGCLSALPYFLNLPIAEACARAGLSYVDLGGNTEIVRRILDLDAAAKRSGAILVPDCGLAPGLVATAAMAAIDGMDEVDWLHLRVGGLPQAPLPPLEYHLSFSIHGLINEYLGEAIALRDGEIVHLPTLDDVESLEFPSPVGRCEAFSTHGGSSTLPWNLAGRVRNFDYKTVRYPGHAEKIRLLRDLGFFGEEALTLDSATLIPRRVSEHILAASLMDAQAADLVVFRVEAQGVQAGRPRRRRLQMIDRCDEASGLSAMQRCTAFPAAEVLQMLLRGEGAGPGAHSLERAIPPAPCLRALRRRGLALEETVAEV